MELFNSGDHLRESFGLSKLHSPVAATVVQGCRALGVFSLLIKWTGCWRTNFHPLYFQRVARDACKMKLVTLSGRSLTVTQGKWQSDPENTAVCVSVCVLPFSHIHTNAEENRCSSAFYSELPQERAEPPAGRALLLLHHDLESL